jgi:hypothetical protein
LLIDVYERVFAERKGIRTVRVWYMCLSALEACVTAQAVDGPSALTQSRAVGDQRQPRSRPEGYSERTASAGGSRLARMAG